MAMFSDEQLALGVQSGCSDDFTLLVERHHAQLLGFIYRLTGGDRLLAEDLVQETFLRLLARIDSYRYPRPLKPWLYAIAVNLSRDHYKRADFRHTDSLQADLDPPAGSTPETEYLAGESARQAVAALRSLPALQREVLLLRHFQELSLNEIAQILQVPVGTVKSRLSLGLQRMKDEVRRTKAEE